MDMTEFGDTFIKAIAAIGGPAGLWTAVRAFRKSKREDELDELDIVTRIRKIAGDELDRSQREILDVRDEAKRQIAVAREDAQRQLSEAVAYYEAREVRLVAGVLAGLYPPFEGTPYASAALTASRNAAGGP